LKRIRVIIFVFSLCFGLAACTISETNASSNEDVASSSESFHNVEVLIESTPFVTASPSPTITRSPTTLPPSPTPILCSSENGTIEENEMDSKWLSQPLEYRVYTPPCYDKNIEKKYPVLYLFHGYGYNDDQWLRLGVQEIADRLISIGDISPFIMVMPHDKDHNNLPPENQFGEAFLYNLVQMIDSNYRTLASRQFRAIGGLSRGGNWAIHLGLDNWQFFGTIGGHSAPLFVSDGPLKVKEWLDKIPPEEYPRIFLDVGENDKWIENILRFEEILDEYNVPHELYVFPGGHSEYYWNSHTEHYLRWYAQGW
jgi:enterochelin esterase-like enzyme